ncbi:alpha-2-macroglobulin [Thiorhodococcus mannitoliphagus]|uniref:Alpha-2-macroglobulin n=1 Tax=Thiorhodococcus mannitoliphagus TaxID=329406 RepID=A0A6P1DQJ2_9GAMM|nr:alpha-2-macroglobulin family protein [Thiorhodococcus mannitoliphagus]NEX18936.1 alpha-2-macroglobulin [Thiorhodococcus mannitoliphagus]
MPDSPLVSRRFWSALAVAWLILAGAMAAEARELVIAVGVDYFGRDYRTLKSVSLDDCKAACREDARCKAFTYNLGAQWCFLKESFAEARPFDGAVSGRVLVGETSSQDLLATRLSELAFLPRRELAEARELEARLAELTPPSARVESLAREAEAALASKQPERALERYREALRLGPERSSLWRGLAEASRSAEPSDRGVRRRLQRQATGAAINAYLRAEHEAAQAEALALLSLTLADRSQWRSAIRAARASLDLVDDPNVSVAYEKLIAEHGFRVTDHKVDSDAASPRICIAFSDKLATQIPNLADFVRVEGHTDLPIEPEAKQICIDGVRHGERYRVLVRAGLPAADGERLIKASDLQIYVRDRSPMVRFLGRAYVLPKGGEAAIPVVTVNTDLVDAKVYRIGDRSLTQAMADGVLRKQLGDWEVERLEERTGELVWAGSVEVTSELNREVTTAVPVGALIQDFQPGIYAMTARPSKAAKDDDNQATQWFIVSDLGLAAFSGNDGLHAMVRSLSTAKPLAEVALRLVAVNNEILGRARTDAAGYVRFEPGLLRGKGGNAPALLVAEGEDGDYGFLDLTQTPFDLSDRGVDGRPAPEPLDVYLVSERGAYRPGETVYLTALVRDARAYAVTGLPITLVVKRPDGVEHLRAILPDQGQGGHEAKVELSRTAMRGTWRAYLYSDPKGAALADLPFLVEDFEPERLTFEITSSAPAIDPADAPTLGIDARFLYGAPASGLDVEGAAQLKPTDALKAFPGYRFGLESESLTPIGGPLQAARTDAQGKAQLALDLPELPATSKLLKAEIQVRVLDESGRPVERERSLAVASKQPRIGVKPLFEGSVEQGGNARFEVIAIDAEGRRVALQGVRWRLSRLQTTFQWYESDGRWDYEPITSSQRVADGVVDLAATETLQLEAPVDWGAYRLALASSDGAVLPADLEFEAGWYVEPTAQDTPDQLKVSLDKAQYRIGDQAKVRIEPRFPGLALVMVMDDRLIAMHAVKVPEAGASIALPVTADWGPGAYVTGVLYRPMDLEARRMPARAIGLTWAGVDPQRRKLAVAFDLPAALQGSVRPRQRIEIPVSVGKAVPGQSAYVTVSAVDLGILNLTRYQAPAPDDWYFAQRRLGMEIRDVYGQLIDRMQGVPGVVRAGGDGSLLSAEGPPPTQDLLAFHSGILALDDQGQARVAIEIPDFNGSVRLMAMAWTADGVGHAAQDLLVRDPIVVTPSMPRFLAPGDRARVRIGLAHVEGAAGKVQLRVSASGGHTRIPGKAQTIEVSLPEGGRDHIDVPILAEGVGDDRLTIDLSTPDGQVLRKTLTIPVRSNAPRTSETQIMALPAGGAFELDRSLLAQRVAGTGSVLVSIGGAGRLDVAGLLLSLDRYPYGCTEQLTSRALPLLYLNQVAASVGLGGEVEAKKRVTDAIAQILGKQTSSGSFGLWSASGSSDLWLDAYVSDFLTRARELDDGVPQVPFEMALDNLRNALSYAPDFSSGGEAVAYALYVLARNGEAAIGDLRYYADTKLDAFATPLAKAQLGAALALYGDRPRANRVFGAALEMLSTPADDDDAQWRADFGSRLRDGAGLLVLAAEAGTPAVHIHALAERLQDQWTKDRHRSTQEEAWLLLAAHALIEGAVQPDLRVGGEPLQGALYRRLDDAALSGEALRIENLGPEPLEAMVTLTGVPQTPEPAGGNGYLIERAYYDLQGRRIDVSRLEQGERLIAVLTVTASAKRQARLILDDPLPAGLEIDNPNLIKAGDIKEIRWLGLEGQATHTEFRADRFVAAVDRSSSASKRFQLAYRLRAVSPGVFAHPAATVEDMYRPRLRAWTDTGRVEILGAQP